MQILGFQIDVLLFAQLIVTAIVIGAFAVRTSLQEAQTERSSTVQMILLADFLTKHHGRIQSILQLAGVSARDPKDQSSDLHWLLLHSEQFRRTGELPPLAAFRASSLAQHLLHLLLAPLTGIAFPIGYAIESGRFEAYRIVHTGSREDSLSKFLYILASNLLLLVALLLFGFPNPSAWVQGVMALAGISAMTTLAGMLKVVRAQMAWKGFWQDALLDIVARAARLDDHDLFNRAMLLHGQVASQPDIPLPGGFGFHVGIYSIVQAALLWISKMLAQP